MTVSRPAPSIMLGMVLIGLIIYGSITATADSRVTDGNQPQWRQTAGPEGGFIISLLNDGPTLFAGTNGGGLYRSTNNGESWTAVNNGLTDQRIRSLAVMGTNLFAGTDTGVYRSADNGESWKAVNTGLSGQNIVSLAVMETDLFAAGTVAVYRSINNGESWIKVTGSSSLGIINRLAVSGTNLFVGTEGGGVLRTTNKGESWTTVNAGLPSGAKISAMIASGTNLFVGVGGFTDIGAVYRSNNQGESWTALGTGLPRSRVPSLAVDGTSILAGTFGRGIFRISENGENWVEVNAGLRYGVVSALALNGANLFAGTQGGVFRSSNDAENWTEANQGIRSTSVCSLAASGTNLFAATRETVRVLVIGGASSPGSNEKTAITERSSVQDLPTRFASLSDPDRIYRSTNRGESWVPFSTGLPKEDISSLAVSGTTLFAGSEGSGIFRSTDNGETWTAVNAGLPPNADIAALIASGTNLFAAVGGFLEAGSVYRLNNQGESWTLLGSGLPESRVTSLAVRGTSLFAGTLSKGVFRIINNETTWKAINAGLPANISITSLVVSGTNIFAGAFGRGIFRSTNNGENWTAVNNGLTDQDISEFAKIGTNLYVGTRGGIFRSINQGESWVAVDTGLVNKNVCSLIASGTNLFAGTEAGATYISDSVAGAMTNVSAASFSGSELAFESIASAFGIGLSRTTEMAATLPLPTTLAGSQVIVRDSLAIEQLAPLFFVSPLQANYLVPTGLASGAATVSLTNQEGGVSLETLRLAPVAPGLFAANGNGKEVAAGLALRVSANGSQRFEPLARFDVDQNKFVPVPIDPGLEDDQVFLVLFGTGFAFRSDLSAVMAKIGGVDAQVTYAGAQGDFPGLNQLNLKLPRSLAGRGEIVVELTVDGKRANTVSVSVR